MTTIDEFRDAVTNHFAWSRRLVWALIAAGLLVFGGAWLAVQVLVPVGSMQFYAFTGLIIGLFAVMVVAIFVGACCNEGRFRIDRRLLCPHCCRPMQLHGALVIETGTCPRCGQRVLADWRAPVVIEKSEREQESIIPRRIERSEGRAVVLRLRLRRLMVAIVYVAVTLALVLYAFTIIGPQNTPFSPRLRDEARRALRQREGCLQSRGPTHRVR